MRRGSLNQLRTQYVIFAIHVYQHHCIYLDTPVRLKPKVKGSGGTANKLSREIDPIRTCGVIAQPRHIPDARDLGEVHVDANAGASGTNGSGGVT